MTGVRRRSIQGDLSVGISMVILVTTVVVCGAFIAMKAELDRRTLVQKVAIMTDNMITALGGPLWNANDSELDGIARTYSVEDGIVQFTVHDFRGDRTYNLAQASDGDLVRQGTFVKNGEVIGTLSVRFSAKTLDQGMFEWVASLIALAVVLNIILVLFVRKIIARLLDPTVAILGRGLARISSGDYTHGMPRSKYQHINAINAHINELAKTLRKREADLSAYNQFLETERTIALSLLTDSVPKIISEFLRAATEIPHLRAVGFISNVDHLPSIPVAKSRAFTTREELVTENGAIGTFVFHCDEAPDATKELQTKRLTLLCSEAVNRLLANQRASALEANLDRSRVMVTEISRAVHILAHDVRKPFTMIKMMFNELARDTDPAAQQKTIGKYTRSVRGSIMLANGLIGDVMTLGAIAALKKKPFPLRSLVAEALEMLFSLEAKRSSIRFRYEFSHEFQPLVDKSKVVRIILNIVENAAQAMRYSGTITFSSRERDGFLILTIANDGPAIPAFVQAMLFEPYYTHGKANGTGLGLAIAKEIATAHGGEISVRSSSTETAFDITLQVDGDVPEAPMPAWLPESSSDVLPDRRETQHLTPDFDDALLISEKSLIEAIVAKTMGRGTPIGVLVVDDETLYLESAQSELANLGIPRQLLEVQTATTPREALRLIAKETFDLVICDVHLEDDEYDGFKLTDRLRKHGFEGHILINSNAFGPSTAGQALAVGADQFFAKPLTRGQLLHAVSESVLAKTRRGRSERLTIYLAEDNVFFLEAWQEELKDHDLVVFSSSDACIDALKSATKKPDILLTDLYFDDSTASGLEVARLAKARFEIPVILSTDAHGDAEGVHGDDFDLVTDKTLAGVREFIERRRG